MSFVDQILSFDKDGIKEGEQGTGTEIGSALKTLKKHMLLEDIARV